MSLWSDGESLFGGTCDLVHRGLHFPVVWYLAQTTRLSPVRWCGSFGNSTFEAAGLFLELKKSLWLFLSGIFHSGTGHGFVDHQSGSDDADESDVGEED